MVRPQSRTIEVHHVSDKHFESHRDVHAFYDSLTETLAKLFGIIDELDALYRELELLEAQA